MLRPVKIRHYIQFMESRGFYPETVLSGSGLDMERLHASDCLVGFKQCQQIVSNMIRLTGDQGIGFEVGRATRPQDLGIVGYAMMTSRNVREALSHWIAYSNSLLGLLLCVEFEEKQSNNYTVSVLETVPLGFIYNFCVEESLMMYLGAGTLVLGEIPLFGQLDFSFPAPAHEAKYQYAFDCPIRFNTPETRFVLNGPDLDKPLHNTDSEFHEICISHCTQLMHRIEASPTAQRLRNLLLQKIRDLPSLADAASVLGMSARTLRRNLQTEGHTYQSVVNAFRYELARDYLKNSTICVKEIAYLLGYKDVNAFRRAFKAWAGQTVTAFRSDRQSHP